MSCPALRAQCEKIILIALCLFAASPAVAAPLWELNQLSILMPLPEREAPNHLWAPKTRVRDGVPLPEQVYQALPLLVIPGDRNWLFEHLRVVAVRIDPCFIEGSEPCQKQIRFVWQPVEQVNGVWRTLDAAIHTFHLLDDRSWSDLVAELAKLNKKFPIPPNLPLGIHPLLKVQGMTGAFATELARILIGHIREKNFIRATAMTVNTEGTIWVFTGFDVKDGQLTRTSIPKTDNVAQAFFSNLKGSPEYITRMNPEPSGEQLFLTLLSDSFQAKQKMSQNDVVEVVRKSLEFGNPRLSNPGTVDCASCHAARALPAWGQVNFPNWDWQGLFAKEIFRGQGNLNNTSIRPERTNVLRSFGYFESDPAISPRVIHETSLAAELMNQAPE